jgi:hypothetical protein
MAIVTRALQAKLSFLNGQSHFYNVFFTKWRRMAATDATIPSLTIAVKGDSYGRRATGQAFSSVPEQPAASGQEDGYGLPPMTRIADNASHGPGDF